MQFVPVNQISDIDVMDAADGAIASNVFFLAVHFFSLRTKDEAGSTSSLTFSPLVVTVLVVDATSSAFVDLFSEYYLHSHCAFVH